MGEVYLALDKTLERRVALKFLPPSLMDDPSAQGRLLDEARSCSRVQHPNIATVYAIEEEDGVHALVMEYVQGRTLREVIAKKTLTLGRVTRIGRAIAEGLIAAHDQGIVHRDLKPANVMLTDRGEVKIMDFGLAFRPERVVNTVGNKAYGTVNYMSPEQARGETPTAASDIFSYGVLLYELLTGACPFQADNDLAVLHQIVSGEPLPLRELRRDVPPALEALIRRCMEKESSKRFPSMREVAAELQYAEPNIENGPKDLISELGRQLAPQKPREETSTVMRRGQLRPAEDGLPHMAEDLRIPISDILDALDERPVTPSRAQIPFDAIPEGFILAPTERSRRPHDSRITDGLVLNDGWVPPPTDSAPGASRRSPASRRDPSLRRSRSATASRAAVSERGLFVGDDSDDAPISARMAPRLRAIPQSSSWKVSFGLLLAILIAIIGFLGLLHAAGVPNVPGHRLLDRLPTSFSHSEISSSPQAPPRPQSSATVEFAPTAVDSTAGAEISR